jgi:16S rRNA (guanine(966)-N(2))-methyltransferase RsmD
MAFCRLQFIKKHGFSAKLFLNRSLFLRVITGSARGRRLITLDGTDVRPTTDKVKEAIFSIIQFEIPGAYCLDLFAGSGQLGIEALSRGASHCVFIDKNPAAKSVVEQNINACGFEDISLVKRNDALPFLSNCTSKFDIVFLDPPYKTDLLDKCLNLLSDKMNPHGIVIAEHGHNFIPADVYGDELKFIKSYRYGAVNLSKFVFGEEES